MWATAVEALAFSSVWVAGAAGALAAAAAAAMGVALRPAALAVVVCGTLLVYNVDRLRDVARDRVTAPRRSAFVARHAPRLALLAAAAGVGALVSGLRVGPEALLVLAPAAALGLGHRRVKHVPFAKSLYVSGCWLLVAVAFPAATGEGARGGAGVAAVLGLALYANAIASNVRDGESAVARIGSRRALAAARAAAAAGCVVALAAPPAGAALRPLACVPGATLLALLPFRPDERFGLVVVDGALLWGGLLAWVLAR